MKSPYLLILICLLSACSYPDDWSSPGLGDEQTNQPNSPGKLDPRKIHQLPMRLPLRNGAKFYGQSLKGPWFLPVFQKRVTNISLQKPEAFWQKVLAIGMNKRYAIIESDGDAFVDGIETPSTIIIDWKTDSWEIYANAYDCDELVARKEALGLDKVIMHNFQDLTRNYIQHQTLPGEWKPKQ